MPPLTFIFIGRSGCGKGTQARLLQDYLVENDTSGRDIFYMETGAKFRDFISQNGFANRLSKEIMENGGLQPEFLAVRLWADELVENFKGNQHVILDGTPRKIREAYVLDGALRFFGMVRPIVINLDISREESKKRLLARGRMDDKDLDDVEKRLNWFESDVVPAIEFFQNNSYYSYIQLNGEQSIEVIHKQLIEAIEPYIKQ